MVNSSLLKQFFKRDNWVNANGTKGTTEEFKDKEGRVVLKRTYDDAGTVLSTQYVYDDFGNLRYVIPPAVTATTITENDATFNELVYAYHYDGRQRVVEKKIPAKGWEFIVYNKLDRVVLVQDAVQRGKNQWSFSKYDAIGRVILTGLVNNSSHTRATLQPAVDGQTVNLWEDRDGSSLGYTERAYPLTSDSRVDILIVNYYDNYSFPGNPFGAPTGEQSLMTRTLLTGTKVKVLDGGTTYLWTVNFYDKEGRVIQSKSTNYLSGQDVVDNTYDFPGQLKISKRTHIVSGKAPLEITTRYEYDHMGRRINTYELIGSDPTKEVLLASYKYNELGQQIKKQLHSENNGSSYLQTVDYAYNIRGWLTKINDANLTDITDQFGLELKYNGNGAASQYNGNISEMTWKNRNPNATTQKAYQFGYDKLNRLLLATSTIGSNFNEVLTYDVMGNIKTLKRNGGSTSLIDDLTYTYKNGNLSNRLESVDDQSANSFGQRKGLTSYDYSDPNGNLIASSNTTDQTRNLSITYNYLNLPKQIKVNNQAIDYTYDAIGRKLRKVSGGVTIDYVGGIHYKAGALEFIQTEEGIARNLTSSYQYQYNLTDHLGNVRATIIKGSQGVETIQESSYYVFGMSQSEWVSGAKNKYLYNGKEQQDDFDLNQYDYGARFYDPVLGRWHIIDPLAELMRRYSPYNYGFDSPVRFLDPDGMAPGSFFDRRNDYDDRSISCGLSPHDRRFFDRTQIDDNGLNIIIPDIISKIDNDKSVIYKAGGDGGKKDKGKEVEKDRNPAQDKPLSDGEIELLEKNGFNHRDKSMNGKRGGRLDLWKDGEGNVYEKPKGNKGPGEPIGYNLKDLKSTVVKTAVGVTVAVVVYEVFKWGAAIILAPETGGASLAGASVLP
ncbi:polymorphic toxin type 33 domain-containing protein [Solitalea canadensis]|uniref:polymorphic toxin type 33 domain-containing protein n=1 Tax=Solitalea canadensis TaxID=995 RepID=UPI001FE19D50|nr:polymorphic toxin type 33 domain-containing protein [Solitalea canadensis]